jgi:hypothetical protein
MRQPDDSVTSLQTPGVPEPAKCLWSLGLRDDVETFWIAGLNDVQGVGQVVVQNPERRMDQLPFVTHKVSGSSLRAVWPYSQCEALATRRGEPADSADWLRDILIAQVGAQLRVDAPVTDKPGLLAAIPGFGVDGFGLTRQEDPLRMV